MPIGANPIDAAYEEVKAACAVSYLSPSTGASIWRLAEIASRFLATKCDLVELVSRVPGKDYISFSRRDNSNIVARAANRLHFITDPAELAKCWRAWSAGNISSENFRKFSYTIALAPCLAMELFDRQNKKGPATYFECLIGHMFAKELNSEPDKKATIPVHGQNIRLTMDFLFTGRHGQKVHLPVKMSTRERVVQAWAHQRILDGAFGSGTYKGIMVLFSETKLDSRTREVVEICVPDQWLAYQTLLSKIERIYYFDLPTRYKALADRHPDVIQIRQFGHFFKERATLLG